MNLFRSAIILLLFLITGSFSVLTAHADMIELANGSSVEASVYVIKDGFHYLKVPGSGVARVRYAARSTRHDTVVMRTGLELHGRVTGYMDDYYYVQLPSSQVKTIVNTSSRSASSTPASSIREGVMFRIHGSNTIGAKLAPSLVAEYFRSLGASRVEIREVKEEESVVSGVLPGATSHSSVEIQSHGSSTAFKGLEKRQCDIGAASRRITADENERLSALGDLMSMKSEHVLAIDGIAVIVHKNNPVFKLSKKELQRIFSGEVADWADFGGRPGRINVYARDDKSGTFDTFKSLVLGKARLVQTAKRYEDSTALSREVSGDPNGIGFIGLPYVLSSKAVAVSDGAEPIPPDVFTIATEDYPLSRRLFLYTPQSSSTAVERFIEFALSEAGQKIVGQNGFVDLAVRTIRPDDISNVSPAYRKMVANASRLSVNFRFSKNSHKLDNKALQDMQRVVRFLNSSEHKGKRIMLLGFTDSLGSFAADQVLSEKRARTVQSELTALGLTIRNADVAGFSKLNPIASNETPEGREKNRRVEIWIRDAGK